MRAQIADDHVGEMVDVEDDFVDAEIPEASEIDFKKSAASDFDECFGARVGEGT